MQGNGFRTRKQHGLVLERWVGRGLNCYKNKTTKLLLYLIFFQLSYAYFYLFLYCDGKKHWSLKMHNCVAVIIFLLSVFASLNSVFISCKVAQQKRNCTVVGRLQRFRCRWCPSQLWLGASWLCFWVGEIALLSPLSVKETLVSHRKLWTYVCKRGQVAPTFKCILLHCINSYEQQFIMNSTLWTTV